MHRKSKVWDLLLVSLGIGLVAFALPSQASAQRLTYVEASDGFGSPLNLSPLSAIDGFSSTINDNLWGVRDIGSESEDNGVAPGDLVIFTAGEGALNPDFGMDLSEDVPELVQTLSGLTPGTNYDVYAVYWSANNADWGVRAGFNPNPGGNQYFNRTGAAATTEDGSVVVPAQAGTLASSAFFDSAPNQFSFGNTNNYLGLVGSQVADNSGEIQVFIDDLATSSADFTRPFGEPDFRRQWFDGLAFVEAGTGITLSASVDLDTGVISLTNDTSFDVNFTSYSLESETTSSLNPQGLTSITGNFDGAGDSSVDSDLWEIVEPADLTSASVNLISESENSGVDGATLSPGQTLTLGAAYLPSAFDSVLDAATLLEVVLTLDSGQELRIAPDFVGTPLAVGDLDFDGDLDAEDFEILAGNLFTDVASLTPTERIALGDLGDSPAGGGLDGLIDFNDVRIFQGVFDAANGPGAFAALTAIPEPSTLGLALMAGVLTASCRRRRTASRPDKNSNAQQETLPPYEKTTMTHPTKSFALAIGVGLLASASAMAQVSLIDHSSDLLFDPTVVGPGEAVAASFLHDTTSINAPDANETDFPLSRVSLDVGDFYGQSFTVSNNAGILQSIFFGYNNARDFGSIQLRVDIGNDNIVNGSNDPLGPEDFLSDPIDLVSGTLSTEGDDTGPVFYLEFDLSAENIFLGPGEHNFTVLGGPLTQDNGGFFFAPIRTGNGIPDTSFEGGNTVGFDGVSGLGGDHFFAVTVEEVDLPSFDLVVDTSDGTVSLVNNLSEAIDFNFYQIESGVGGSGASLTPEGLIGIGAGGAGDFLAAGGNSESIVGEASLSDSLLLQPGESQFLGALFDATTGLEDLEFSFGVVGGDSLTPGEVVYVSNDSIAAPGLLGDFNGDGIVGPADYAVWRDNLGLSEAALNGAGNGDGTVTRLDYELFARNFGLTSSALAATTAVPEPTAAALLFVVAGSMLSAAQRR